MLKYIIIWLVACLNSFSLIILFFDTLIHGYWIYTIFTPPTPHIFPTPSQIHGIFFCNHFVVYMCMYIGICADILSLPHAKVKFFQKVAHRLFFFNISLSTRLNFFHLNVGNFPLYHKQDFIYFLTKNY